MEQEEGRTWNRRRAEYGTVERLNIEQVNNVQQEDGRTWNRRTAEHGTGGGQNMGQ